MTSPRKSSKAPYHPQDLASLLNDDEWSPTSLFPKPAQLDRNVFPPEPQPYLDLIRKLSEKGHPDLKYLWTELSRQNGTLDSERSRAVVLEYSTSDPPSQEVPFTTSRDLKAYLGNMASTSCNRLYILEDISANYVEAFGSHFSIEPSFWAEQLRTPDKETSKTAGVVSGLPSVRSLNDSFSLIYPEYTIIDDPERPRIQDTTGLFADSNLYRKVFLNRRGEFYNGVAIVNRRASFWSRKKSDGSWDGIILIDPPLIRRDMRGSSTVHPFIYSHDYSKSQMIPLDLFCHEPWQGGYIDFVSVTDSTMPNYTGPPRTSLFDDLMYYNRQSNPAVNSFSTPDAATSFLKSIIAGIWMNSISYIGMSVASLEYAIEQARKKSSTSTSPSEKITSYGRLEWLENNLSHVYSWKRKCTQLRDWTNCNLQELQYSGSQLKRTGSSILSMPFDEQRDWVLIKTRLEHYETCSRDVVTSALGLLSLIESHKSVEEAESARVLALLGTVYLPLSLTAGILSMGGSFTPGQGHFWIFFAVAGPLMVLSLAATYTPTLMRTMISRATSQKGKEAMGGLNRVPTFVKGSNETV